MLKCDNCGREARYCPMCGLTITSMEPIYCISPEKSKLGKHWHPHVKCTKIIEAMTQKISKRNFLMQRRNKK